MHFYQDGKEVSLENVKGVIERFKEFGVIAVKDMGHKNGFGLEVKKRFGDELKIFTAGYALYKKGGYGKFLGREVDGEKNIIENVRALIKGGADFIKIINSGIVTSDPANPISKGGFDKEELKIIINETKNYDKEVFCHVNGRENIYNAVFAGVSSIEHGFFIDEEILYMMKEKKITWTPTISALDSVIPFLKTEREKNYIKTVVKNHIKMVRFAYEIGVKLRIGTDSGSKGIFPGSSIEKEVAFFKLAQIPHEAILKSLIDF